MLNQYSPKFFIGPMTQNIIDSVIEVANERKTPIGLCVSRRQIDYAGGYVGYNTLDFVHYVKQKTAYVPIERDHSGLGQGTNPGVSSFEDLNSIINDAWCGIDIIHIDPWKRCYSYEEGLRETINNIVLAFTKNSEVKFEIGTEEAIRPFSPREFNTFLYDLKRELGDNLFKRIKYAVVQSGVKLSETKNIGIPNIDRLRDMVTICYEFGLLSKEHNGDYLSDKDIKLRFNNGLDSMNIAPEFGVLETNVLLDHIINDKDFNKIYDICLNGKKWTKWISKDFDVTHQKRDLIKICGHYHNKEIKQIVNIDDNIIKEKIKERLYHLLEL